MSGSATGTVGINGGLDTSIPLQAGRGVQQTNPLESIGRFANTQNALNQAKLFPGQLQLQQQAIQGGATSLAQQQYRAAYGSLIPLLAKKPGTITVDDVAAGLGSAEKHLGIITQPTLEDLTANAPPPNTPEYDQYIRSRVASMSQGSPETAVGQVTPQAGPMVSTGSSVVPTLVSPAGLPNTGVVTQVPSASIGVGLTPGERASQVTRPATAADVAANPSLTLGQPITETLETRLQSQGAGNLVLPGGIPGLPPSLRNPANATPPAVPPQPAPAANPQPIQAPRQDTAAPGGGAVPTALPPGAPEALSASAAHYAAVSNAANNFQTRMFPLRQALNLIRGDNSPDTGPGSETVNHLRSFLIAQTPQSLQSFLPGVGVDAIKVANYDQLAKYLAQYASNQPGAGGTDLRLTSSQLSQPNTHINKQAAADLLVKTIGVENMQQAAKLQFDKTGGGQMNAAAFDPYMAKFATNADPYGYAWDLLSPAERAAHFATLDARGKHNYLASVRAAQDSGVTRSEGQ